MNVQLTFYIEFRKLFLKALQYHLNLEFTTLLTSCLNKIKEPNLPNYLPIVWSKEYIPFPKALAGGKEMDSCLSQEH